MIGLPWGCIISIMILFLPQLYWFFLMFKGAIKVGILFHKPYLTDFEFLYQFFL